ncbi:acetyltransferase [Zooshikella ganghwensis]|uniref:acetyltransferase n=1 Tax=Zooshikella ganghwensis TaxID=202772 RepID=UPI000418EAEB|nr:acetyltransferase [Zooshikella ganghwensis]
MSRLAIFGASGHGKVIADIATKLGKWLEIDFFDDRYPKITKIGPWSIIGNSDSLKEYLGFYSGVIIGIGDNSVRYQKHNLFTSIGAKLVNIIDPSANISSFTCLGTGVVVMPGAVINIGAKISDACIINSNSVVEHDCTLNRSAHLSPGACLAGGVTIGNRSWIGAGSVVRQCITITDDVVIGAGSVVVNNIDESGIYMGTPVTKLKK